MRCTAPFVEPGRSITSTVPSFRWGLFCWSAASARRRFSCFIFLGFLGYFSPRNDRSGGGDGRQRRETAVARPQTRHGTLQQATSTFSIGQTRRTLRINSGRGRCKNPYRISWDDSDRSWSPLIMIQLPAIGGIWEYQYETILDGPNLPAEYCLGRTSPSRALIDLPCPHKKKLRCTVKLRKRKRNLFPTFDSVRKTSVSVENSFHAAPPYNGDKERASREGRIGLGSDLF